MSFTAAELAEMAAADAEIEQEFEITPEEAAEADQRDFTLKPVEERRKIERSRMYCRRYYERHKAETSAHKKLYYQANRERILARAREYKQKIKKSRSPVCETGKVAQEKISIPV